MVSILIKAKSNGYSKYNVTLRWNILSFFGITSIGTVLSSIEYLYGITWAYKSDDTSISWKDISSIYLERWQNVPKYPSEHVQRKGASFIPSSSTTHSALFQQWSFGHVSLSRQRGPLLWRGQIHIDRLWLTPAQIESDEQSLQSIGIWHRTPDQPTWHRQ